MSDRDRLWQERAIEDGVTEQIEYETSVARIHGLGSGDFVEVSGLKLHIKQTDADYDRELQVLEEQRARGVVRETVNRGAARHYAKLRDMGASHEAAMEMTANAEHEVQDDHSEDVSDEYLGDTTANLMRPGYTIVKGGGGGASGRKRGPKPRPVRSHADMIIDDEIAPRSSFVGARVSQDVKDALKAGEVGVTAGQVIEAIVGTAVACHLTPAQIQLVIDNTIKSIESMRVDGAA